MYLIKNFKDATLHEKFMRVLLDPVDYTAPYVERTADWSKNSKASCGTTMEENILREKTESNEKAKQFLNHNINLVSWLLS